MKNIWKSNLILDDDIPLTKTLELYNMVTGGRSAFHEVNKYYPPVF